MFQFSERHIEEYRTLGYTVFRGIVPTSMVNDLRRECEKGREQARRVNGPQTQRLQPVAQFDVDQKLFQDWCDLPAVRDAVTRVIGLEHKSAGLDLLGVLLEPQDEPWCTQWHRDWRDNVSGLDIEEWNRVYLNDELFNQVNCALYEDTCTWVVPGSHLRLDTEEEIARFPERPIAGPQLEGLSGAERERACIEYCNSMPGAQRLLLDAGDFCLYRNSLWHLGNYTPDKKRATLHDSVFTAAFKDWWTTAPAKAAERRAQGITWENPNRVPVAS